MDTIRNFINVIGITPENELPDKAKGQLIQYSDTETIIIPENRPGAKSIFQIMIQVEIKSKRIIKAPLLKTLCVDGIKRYKIIYSEDSDDANFLVIETPYNTFIEIPKEYEGIDSIEIYIMDAYFSLLDRRRIYSYILYLVHADYSQGTSQQKSEISSEANLSGESDTDKSISDFSQIHNGVMGEVLVSMESEREHPSSCKTQGSDSGNDLNNLIDIDEEYL